MTALSLGLCCVGCETLKSTLGIGEEKFDPGKSTTDGLLSNVAVSPDTFNPDKEFASFSYGLHTSAEVSLTITDSKLRQKKAIEMGFQEPGVYSINWAGKNDKGEILGSGAYNWYLIAETGSAKAIQQISERQVVSGKVNIKR